jgi:hypothetical protein
VKRSGLLGAGREGRSWAFGPNLKT